MRQIFTLVMVGFLIAYSGCFIVDENSLAVVHNKVTDKDHVYATGTYFALPLITQMRYVYKNKRENLAENTLLCTTQDGYKVGASVLLNWQVVKPLLYLAQLDKVTEKVFLDKLFAGISIKLQQQIASLTLKQLNAASDLTISLPESLNSYGIIVHRVYIENITVISSPSSAEFTGMPESTESNRSINRESMVLFANGVAKVDERITTQLTAAQILVESAYYIAQGIKTMADTNDAVAYAAIRNKDPKFYNYFRTIETYRETARSKADVPPLSQIYP